MTIPSLFKTTDLNNSLLLGYYGGGNYGDELLLSTFIKLFEAENSKNISYYYINEANHAKLKHSYRASPIFSKSKLVKEVFSKEKIIVGGGGHWGMDMNISVFVMSVLLFISKVLLGKKVYLLGVGFYNSTNWLGRLSALLASRHADCIVARDVESYKNFKKVSARTYLDRDAVFYLGDLISEAENIAQMKVLQKKLNYTHGQPIVLIALRRFRNNKADAYLKSLQSLLNTKSKAQIILLAMEPIDSDAEYLNLLKQLKIAKTDRRIVDFDYNPVDLVSLLRHLPNIKIIAPQYHLQLVAHVAGLGEEVLPMFYDNKVKELHRMLGWAPSISIENVNSKVVEEFLAK